MKVSILSVVPSPYQRDLFAALERKLTGNLQVFYLEETAPDSPWPRESLASWEHILPGRTLGRGRVRCHFNWQLPSFDSADIVIINTALTDWTTQELMRRLSRQGKLWVFWGECLRNRSGVSGAIQSQLISPLQQASTVVAIGQKAQEDFQRRLPNTPVENLPYHCAIDSFLKIPPRQHRDQERTFLFCGQMIHRKGFDVLLRAFAALPDKAKLILAGRKDSLDTQIQALDETTRRRIDNRGFVAPRDLPELYAQADVFVLPSRHDGWGVVINQALAAGLPIIATDAVGAATDLITSGREGLVIPPNDSQSLQLAMMTLLQNAELCQRQSQAARKRALHLHPDQGAAQWITILAALVQDQFVALAS